LSKKKKKKKNSSLSPLNERRSRARLVSVVPCPTGRRNLIASALGIRDVRSGALAAVHGAVRPVDALALWRVATSRFVPGKKKKKKKKLYNLINCSSLQISTTPNPQSRDTTAEATSWRVAAHGPPADLFRAVVARQIRR
jgi:hypothetical protein